MDILQQFETYLNKNGKSKNTTKTYLLNIKKFLEWFFESYSYEFSQLYRPNILEYKSYLMNIKKYKGKTLSSKTINSTLSSIKFFNIFLVENKFQNNIVIEKNDFLKIQINYVNPTDCNKKDIESFRQKILEDNNLRLYSIVTLISYSGTRISETLNIKLEDLNLQTKELLIRTGKGKKQRTVYLNAKIIDSIREYLKVRLKKNSCYLFTSRESDKVTRTVINKEFKKYSKSITPHQLRHFFCSNALEKGFAIHEVANLAGHNSIQTTLIYTNPNRETMKNKIELL